MNLEALREYCLSKPLTKEAFPFDEYTLVFYVADKMFALTGLDNIEVKVNLKCDPEYAIELRECHEQIIPGYHMNKKHWNTVTFDGLDWLFIKRLIDHSYKLVIKGFSKKKCRELGLI